MDGLKQGDAEAAAVAQTPNRVTLEAMQAKVATVEYHNPALSPEMTVAFVKLTNGYVLIGKSAPADAANFNAELGRKFAVEDAIRQMWPLEGYMLRERLAAEG